MSGLRSEQIIINKSDKAPEGYSVVYACCPSVFGNPFVMKSEADWAQVSEHFDTRAVGHGPPLYQALCAVTRS